MDLPSLSAEQLQQSDEDLGWWLLSTWIGYQAQKAGVPLDAIPSDWAAQLVEATGRMDSDSVTSAPLESMFRKACAGNFDVAGRMLRNYVRQGGETLVAQQYASIGIAHAVGRKRGGKNAGDRKKRDAAPWQAECIAKAKDMLAKGTASHELAGKLAARFGKHPTVIRKVLKNASVK